MTTTLYTLGSPVVLAHRGGMAEVAENTRAAVEHLRSTGVEVMETDLRHTSDGVVVLAHDTTLRRRFGDPREVSDLTWWELEHLRDVDGERVLRLEEVLADYPDLVLNLDVKTDGALAGTLRAVRAARAADRVCLTAFDSRRVAVMERLTRGQVALGMGMADVARLLAQSRGWRSTSQRHRAVQVPMTFRGVPVVTPAFVEAAHECSHVVHVWTVNAPEQIDTLLDLGVDGVVTDVPSVAAEVFRRRGLTPGLR